MSLLNYIITDNQVLVLTDTQITDSNNKEILSFGEKAYFLPSLKILTAATGRVDIFQNWYFNVITNDSLHSAQDIISNGSTFLREIENNCNNTEEIDSDTTIYNFMKIDNVFQCSIFRSTKDWELERQRNCYGIKPNYLNDLPAINENERESDYIFRMAFLQKEIDDAKGLEKVGIGGSILQYLMDDETYSIKELAKFENLS